MPNKMLIDASHPEETRVVVTRGNRIEEFDFESQDKKQLRGNIYLARVTRVEPSLQAAFVEYGGNRHGFLAFSEIHPDYYQIPVADRQALLKAEAEAANEEDSEEDEPRGERSRASNGRRRRRGRRTRNGDGVKAEGSQTETENPASESEASETGSDAIVDDDAARNGEEAHDENGDDDGAGRDGPAVAAEASADVISEPVVTDASDEDRSHADEQDNSASEEREVVESVGADDALDEARDRRRTPRRHYKIQEVVKRRQILLVQVVKEERGNKGAALTTYLSLAGRYSVLMPNTARGGGISRKITSAQDRKRLKDVVKDLDVPQGMGVILRTAGENRTKAEIKRDYEYLMRMWENVRNLTLKSTAPTLVYEEGSLIKRSVRDLYNKDIEEILVAGEDGYREAKDFMRMLMPSHAKMVQPYRDTTPIFARSGIEAQLDRMLQPQVTLKSGGYIIINQTEALVSIDVNSGRSTREHSIEDTALQTNLEAAEEVARQLRLRDLAGLIVIDFIDMEEGRNNRAVEKRLKDCLKNDRARIQVGRISHFGLLEMSRQRIRASVLESTMKPCPHCGGTGHVRSDSSVALMVVRAIEDFLLKDNHHHITVRTPAVTALYVLNHKRGTLVSLESKFGVTITVEADDAVGAQHYAIFRGAAVENPVEISEIKPPLIEEEDADDDVIVGTLEDDADEAADETPAQSGDSQDAQRKRKRRRRRRGGKDRDTAQAASPEHTVQDGDEPLSGEEAVEADGGESEGVATDAEDKSSAKKRRRGKRGGRRNREGDEGDSVAEQSETDVAAQAEETTPPAVVEIEEAVEVEKSKPARKPRRGSKAAKAAEEAAAKAAEETIAEAPEQAEAEIVSAEAPAESVDTVPAAPTARRASRRSAAAASESAAPKLSSTGTNNAEQPAPKKGWWQRKGFF